MVARSSALLWMGSAAAAATAAAAAALAVFGAGERGTDIGLQATARLSFVLFWLAYAGGGLAEVWGARFLPLKRRARDLGLAFAAAQAVHVSLVAWLCWIGAAPPLAVFVFFGSALACVCVLTVFSIARLQRLLGAGAGRLLRIVCLNWIAFAFASDFIKRVDAGPGKYALLYLPFVVLSLLGPVLYWIAFTLALERLRRQPT